MKVAVYSIALNEEKFVERWYECAKEADYLLIADTGSSDRTVELAKSLGINVVEISINPWRFDDARNASLAVIPGDIDYCIALDLDEVLVPGWRKHLEVAYKNKWTRASLSYSPLVGTRMGPQAFNLVALESMHVKVTAGFTLFTKCQSLME
jgi:glycosyltransferase involved in cell wall biosynthesis